MIWKLGTRLIESFEQPFAGLTLLRRVYEALAVFRINVGL